MPNPLSSPLWALQPEAAEAFFDDLRRALRAESETPAPPAALPTALSGQGSAARPYALQSGVAVIPVHGAITRQTEYAWWNGRPISQGQDSLAAALAAALADPTVRAILLDVNSPGGTVPGTKELADAIAIAAATKPMAAYANGLMASAAMWLSAATGRIFAPVTATIGSVGVIMVHTDFSKLNERWGLSYTYITGGKLKSAGNPDAPLSDEARALFQKQVTEIHEIFKADVISGLKITAPAAQWAEGQTMLAGEAKACGLVTTIVRDLDSAITLLRQEATMDLKTFAAQHPDLLAEIQNQARAEALKDADAKAAAAVQSAQSGVLAVVTALCSQEASAKIADLVQAGVTSPEQLAAVARLLPAASSSAPDAAKQDLESQARAAILAGIQAATPAPVAGAAPGAEDEAEARAAVERMSKL
ncbi:S49 family peptidase [Desulfovibrio sp. OttesenSCG-928-G11]|nr:S49 family peptidase [Desulfovibrio sp. OttesenSCG-928-G11]